MANHKSSIKRIRSNEAKRVLNKYQAKTTRNAVSALRKNTNKKEAADEMKRVSSLLDKLAKRNIIHKNKAANIKSSLQKQVSNLK
ncbi:MAG TPA: 30S ribosomal protein S20 [Flavobacteriales bacterium]|nr:30S ribosomal protein S20 [Flavobacteriales bacterium]HIN39240.1 30S ribosomal protein S20 [Flavobacteriales bacterium]